MIKTKTKVLYHASCHDGFCAAWVASKVLGRGPDVEYVPVQYGSPPPDVVGCQVYILDFSYTRSVMEQIKRDASFVLCLDHHKTAEAELAGLDYCVFDMNKSGARLAWERFNGLRDQAPWLVAYTEDRDLWRWKLGESRMINDGLRTYPFDFTVWDDLTIIDCLEAGEVLSRYLASVIKDACKNAMTVQIGGYPVPVVNCTMRDAISDVAAKLAEQSEIGIGGTFFVDSKGRYVYSLRSRGNGPDVSLIAKAYGGGGHAAAAGFSVDARF